METERAASGGRSFALNGEVRLRLQAASQPEMWVLVDSLRLRYGDAIRVLVRLRRPRIYQNPGSFDFRRWMESTEDIYWVGTIKDPRLVEKLPPHRPLRDSGHWLSGFGSRLLRSIDDLYPRWSAEGRCGTVLKAVLLGDRSSLDSETIENFRKTRALSSAGDCRPARWPAGVAGTVAAALVAARGTVKALNGPCCSWFSTPFWLSSGPPPCAPP